MLIALFHLYVNAFAPMNPLLLRSSTLSMIFILAFFKFYIEAKNSYFKMFYIVLILAGISVWLYMILQFNTIIYRAGVSPTTLDIIFGSITIFLIFELTRKSIGYTLFVFALIVLAYSFFGANLPGILSHMGYGINRVVSFLYGPDGIFGMSFSVVSTYLIVFLILSGFLEVTGTGKFVIDLSMALTGKMRGGPAKVAIIASSLFGTISGSTMANVIATGTFTIPMMKKLGYKPHFAAAVETAASSGGQIMPPVMGAAAFIMIELTGTPYTKIIKAAIIPAILYYIAIFWMVHLEAIKEDLSKLDAEDVPNVKEVLASGWHLTIPIVVLLFALIYLKFSPITAGLMAIVSSIPASWLQKETRIDIKKAIEALSIGGRGLISISGSVAIAGIILGVFSLTGLGAKLGISLLTFTHDNLYLTLALTAVFAIVLGMGQPSISAYIVVAAIAAPSIIALGIPVLTAHLFVFYFATFSNVTPPVAVASYVAAAIAKADPLKTAFTGFKLSIAAFIVPFIFVVYPGLLLSGSFLSIIQGIVSTLIGILALGSAFQRWFITRLNIIETIILAVVALLTLIPGLTSDIIGIIILGGFYAKKLIERNREQVKHYD